MPIREKLSGNTKKYLKLKTKLRLAVSYTTLSNVRIVLECTHFNIFFTEKQI